MKENRWLLFLPSSFMCHLPYCARVYVWQGVRSHGFMSGGFLRTLSAFACVHIRYIVLLLPEYFSLFLETMVLVGLRAIR